MEYYYPANVRVCRLHESLWLGGLVDVGEEIVSSNRLGFCRSRGFSYLPAFLWLAIHGFQLYGTGVDELDRPCPGRNPELRRVYPRIAQTVIHWGAGKNRLAVSCPSRCKSGPVPLLRSSTDPFQRPLDGLRRSSRGSHRAARPESRRAGNSPAARSIR